MSLDNIVMPAVIDAETEGKVTINERQLVVPPELHIVGVENDNNVENIYFEVPRYFDGVNDLDTFDIRVNWINALKEVDSSPVEKISSTESIITVKWQVPRGLCVKEGDVEISIQAVHSDGRTWNTTTVQLQVLKGIVLSDSISKQYPDIINELLIRVQNLESTKPSGGNVDLTGYAKTTDIDKKLLKKLDKNQGVENSGKILEVGSNGDIILVKKTNSEVADDKTYGQASVSINCDIYIDDNILKLTAFSTTFNYIDISPSVYYSFKKIKDDLGGSATLSSDELTISISIGYNKALILDRATEKFKIVGISEIYEPCIILASHRVNEWVKGDLIELYYNRLNAQGYRNNLYLDPVSKIELDFIGNYTYFKYTSNERFMYLYFSTYVYFDDIVKQIPDVASVEGNTLTLKVHYMDVLIYDFEKNTFLTKRMPKNYKFSEILCLSTTVEGIVGGCFYQQYINRLARLNEKKLDELKSNVEPVSNSTAQFLDNYAKQLTTASDNNSQLFFFTDAHCFYDKPYEILDEYKKLFTEMKEVYDHASFDNCMSGGDFIGWGEPVTKELGFKQLGCIHGMMNTMFRNYKPTFGNHEYAFYTVHSNHLSDTQVNNTYMPEYDNLYYSYETLNNKFIVLKTDVDGNLLISSEQKNWLKRELKSAKKDIIVVQHIAIDGTTETADTAFIPEVFKDIVKELDNYNNRVGEYSGGTKKVVCVLSGHTHFYYHIVSDSGIHIIAFDRLIHNKKPNYYGVIIDNGNHQLKITQSSGENITYQLII